MRRRSMPTALRATLAGHALLTLLVVVVVYALVAVAVVGLARQDAYRSAERVASQVSAAVLLPLSKHDFTRPIDPARPTLDADVEPFLVSGMIHRVKVWTVRGGEARIVYSDERRIEGESNRLSVVAAQRVDAGEIQVSAVPDDAEHRFEAREAGGLLEAFVGFRDAGGAPARLEVYVPIDQAETVRVTASALLPLLLGGLLVLGAAMLPMSVALGRRIERERAEQRAVRRYGLTAAETATAISRSEMARRLHDRVIPDLAGASLLLETARNGLPGAGAPVDRDLVGDAHDLVTTEVQQLRALLGDLVPTEPTGWDPQARFHGLAGTRLPEVPAERHPQITVEVDLNGAVPEELTLVLYGVAGELLRNAIRHAAAERVRIRLTGPCGRAVRLTVDDDGTGFDPDATGRTGHVGLLLVRRVLDDHGGRLEIASTSGGDGTTVTASVPAGTARDTSPVEPSGASFRWKRILRPR